MLVLSRIHGLLIKTPISFASRGGDDEGARGVKGISVPQATAEDEYSFERNAVIMLNNILPHAFLIFPNIQHKNAKYRMITNTENLCKCFIKEIPQNMFCNYLN